VAQDTKITVEYSSALPYEKNCESSKVLNCRLQNLVESTLEQWQHGFAPSRRWTNLHENAVRKGRCIKWV